MAKPRKCARLQVLLRDELLIVAGGKMIHSLGVVIFLPPQVEEHSSPEEFHAPPDGRTVVDDGESRDRKDRAWRRGRCGGERAMQTGAGGVPEESAGARGCVTDGLAKQCLLLPTGLK